MAPILGQRARAVDRTFERLYRRHVTDVYRYSLAVLHNPADAEDVTQTTFLNAYRALERGEQPRAAHNWLIAIAHNVCRQRFRQAARRPAEVAWDDDIADKLVEESATFARRQRAARAALKSLGAVPLPASLASVFGGGGGTAAAGAVAAAKVAAVVAATAAVGGVSYESVHQVLRPAGHRQPPPA